MSESLLSTKKMEGMRVVDSTRNKRIGKVRSFVFHPSERRVVGFLVKRPDAALMFHRKDLFVSLGGFSIVDGCVVVRDGDAASGKGAVKALDLDWDSCVIWAGMPVVTVSGEFLGYVDAVTFDALTGKVGKVCVMSGMANDAILGKRSVPASLVKGFKRGLGDTLAMTDRVDQADAERSETGAILVADEAASLEAEGGIAQSAGKASAVVVDKAKKGTAKARVVVGSRAEKAKPAARKVADTTKKAASKGAYATGKQLGRASGMFAAFKEEFDKAMNEEEDVRSASGASESGKTGGDAR